MRPVFDTSSIARQLRRRLNGFRHWFRMSRHNPLGSAPEVLTDSADVHLAVLNNSPDCIKLLDLRGTLLWMNEGGQRLMEIRNQDAVIGLSWVEYWKPPYRDEAAKALASALMNEVSRFTAACETAKGTLKWWDVVVTPIRDRSDKVQHLLAISRDVSDYMALFDERDSLLERERAARLEVEKANRKRDYALLVAAHELGAPLYAVRGWAQYLQLGDHGSAAMSEAIDAIVRNTERQYQLVEQLLEVARFRSESGSLNLVKNSLGAILRSALDSVRPAARSKNIAVLEQLPEDVWIMSDYGQLQRAFSNVLFNAVKFTPEDGTIRIQCRIEGSSARVDMADSGIGISPGLLDEVFEPFSQAGGYDRRPSVGLGLGLSIVRRIVEAHHGTVIASSGGLGLGSTFSVTLPHESPRLLASGVSDRERLVGSAR